MKISAFYSDPHFYHTNVIQYSRRPFANAEQMNEELIRLYNERVSQHHVVLWLGDCFFCPTEQAQQIMMRLNGTKILVRGNHDRPAAAMAKLGFALVADQLTLCIAGRKVVACHFPYAGEGFGARRPERHKDQILLHGHTHSAERYRDGMVHCGVDAWDYRPALYEEVEALVR